MLPQLAALGLTPERIARFALRIRDADRALNIMTSQLALAPSRDGINFARTFLRTLPRAVAVRFVQLVLRDVGGDRKPHALAAVETLTDALVREPVKATTLHGCIVRSDGVDIRIEREPVKGSRARRPQDITSN